jgi:hypothetical protein
MTLAAAPHPMSVFRYLKTAWRLWLATGNAATVTVNTPASQAAASPLVVTGTVVADPSVPKPIEVKVNLNKDALFVAQQSGLVNATTGAWTVTFPGGTTTATTTATVTPYAFAAGVGIGATTTPNFTLT